MPSASTSSQMQSISGIITQFHATTGEIPPPLVGPSVTVVGNQLFVFGGRLTGTRRMTNHMYILDLNTLCWTRYIPPPDSMKPPRERYFHTADVYKRRIVVFGGMGHARNSADGLCVLDDVSVFDVDTMTWSRPIIEPSLFAPRSRYAHLSAITKGKLIIIGGQDMGNNYLEEINILDLNTWQWVNAMSFDKQVGVYRSVAVSFPGVETTTWPSNGKKSATNTSPGNQPWSDKCPIYMYTNVNFTDVKRDLQKISYSTTTNIQDCTAYMAGTAMPPGLRFPYGHALGHHLLVGGTYLSSEAQAFSIWALNLNTLTWTRIDHGSALSFGSWNRGVVHEAKNRYLVLGHQDRSLVDDYNDRQTNFDHVAIIDLEAYGVYKPPNTTCSTLAQEMGLGLLNDSTIADFTIITNDKQVVPVNSAILAQKWPYFASLLRENQEQEADASNNQRNQSPNTNTFGAKSWSHRMVIPYDHPVVIALVQFFYTDHLLAAHHYQPYTLSQLLLLADMYHLQRLSDLVTHALHQILNVSTAPLIFETAALSQKTSLQVRALKFMIETKKMMDQQPPSPEVNRNLSSTSLNAGVTVTASVSKKSTDSKASSKEEQEPRSKATSIFRVRAASLTPSKHSTSTTSTTPTKYPLPYCRNPF